MKALHLLLFAIVATCTIAPQAKGQTGGTDAKALVNSQNYVFEAQWVSPMGARARALTSLYTLKVTKDTIIADLPYFGKAYSAPIDASQGGIAFTSTKFVYEAKPFKKGWDITIKPADNRETSQMELTIFTNGSATLYVNSTNRQGISFTGFIRAKNTP